MILVQENRFIIIVLDSNKIRRLTAAKTLINIKKKSVSPRNVSLKINLEQGHINV